MKLFFDINKKTMPQQVKKNKEDIEAQHQINVEIDEKIDKEIQDRTDADIGLLALIQTIQRQLNSLGDVLTMKGSVETIADLPATNNHIGDVYFVVSEQAGYVWIDDDGTERWELLGLNIDLSAYATKSEVESGLAEKQDKLTAGTNISIINNVISAISGSDAKKYVHNIYLYGSGNKYIYFSIINSQLTAMTINEIASFIDDITDAYNLYLATGTYDGEIVRGIKYGGNSWTVVSATIDITTGKMNSATSHSGTSLSLGGDLVKEI